MTTATVWNLPQKFVIARLFDASREVVFDAWTNPAHMSWWGPKGVTIHARKLELHPGGAFHYYMLTDKGDKMWGKWVMREIVKPERLVFVNSFSDEAEGITRHPMAPHWPLEMLSTITFEDQDGKTLLTVEWIPINASEIECKAFNDGHESMKNGWTGTLDKLTEYLASAS